MRAVRQRQPRQRVLRQRIRPALQKDRVGPETGHGGQDHLLQHQRELRIVEPAPHRQVEGRAARPVPQRTGEGPAPRLVDRDRAHPLRPGKGRLHPVAVMRVDVDIGHALQPHGQQPADGQHRLVEKTEALCPVRHGVMLPAARVVDDTALGHQLRRQQPAAHRRRGTAVHLGKDRVRQRAQPVPVAHLARHLLRRLRRHQRLDVTGRVEAGQRGGFRTGRGQHPPGPQPPQCRRQIGHRRHPLDRERMPRAIDRAAVDPRGDETCPCHASALPL